MYKFPHTFIYPVWSVLLNSCLAVKGKEGIAAGEVQWGVQAHIPSEPEDPWTQGKLSQLVSTDTTAPNCQDPYLNRPPKHCYYGAAITLMSTLQVSLILKTDNFSSPYFLVLFPKYYISPLGTQSWKWICNYRSNVPHSTYLKYLTSSLKFLYVPIFAWTTY